MKRKKKRILAQNSPEHSRCSYINMCTAVPRSRSCVSLPLTQVWKLALLFRFFFLWRLFCFMQQLVSGAQVPWLQLARSRNMSAWATRSFWMGCGRNSGYSEQFYCGNLSGWEHEWKWNDHESHTLTTDGDRLIKDYIKITDWFLWKESRRLVPWSFEDTLSFIQADYLKFSVSPVFCGIFLSYLRSLWLLHVFLSPQLSRGGKNRQS